MTKRKSVDITKQSDGAGGIKWAKDVFEQEIKGGPWTHSDPIAIIKMLRQIWAGAFGEGQRYREQQIIEFLERRIATKEANDPTFHECNQVLKFVRGFTLYHIDD